MSYFSKLRAFLHNLNTFSIYRIFHILGSADTAKPFHGDAAPAAELIDEVRPALIRIVRYKHHSFPLMDQLVDRLDGGRSVGFIDSTNTYLHACGLDYRAPPPPTEFSLTPQLS